MADAVAEGERISALLTGIGQTLATHQGNIPKTLAVNWLAEAENILVSTLQIQRAAQDAVAGARWSPMIGHAEPIAATCDE